MKLGAQSVISPDLKSLAVEFVFDSPQRADNAIRSIGELTEVIKSAEARICKIISKSQTHEVKEKEDCKNSQKARICQEMPHHEL